MNNKLEEYKSKFIGLLVICGVIALVFKSCFGKTDEFGILGMDKNGRQVMLQTLNTSAPADMRYTSEWEDTIFIQRLWQEPMRTTFRVVMTTSPENESLLMNSMALGNTELFKNTAQYLDSPFELFLQEYNHTIMLQEELDMPIDEFKNHCREKGVSSIRSLLGGLGFKHYQIFINKTEMFGFDLPATNKTFHGG